MSDRSAFAPYTVIMPAFNAARTLHDVISSVLAQTVPPHAIIVVDDGSTDETSAIASAFGERVSLATQSNQGPAAATDRAIALSRTDLIAGLDADDLWVPTKAERQLSLLAERPDVDAVFCHTVAFRHGDAPDFTRPARESWSRSAMMMRRSSAERAGSVFDASNPRGLGEMIRWFDHGRRCGLRFEMMPDVLFGRRIIEGSLSYAHDPSGFLPLIRAKLAKRP